MEDSYFLQQMQQESFAEQLAKYGEAAGGLANESVASIAEKIQHPDASVYFLVEDNCKAGAMRIMEPRNGEKKKIAMLFVLPAYQNRGYAQQAIREAERIHGPHGWRLDTILQEAGNCHLYEKMGYHRTGHLEQINDRMTIVYYEKD